MSATGSGVPMIFRQLIDSETWTYTYLLADPASKQAILIDTVFEKHLRDLALIRELGLKLEYTIDTHVHADHITGAWLMQQEAGSQIVMSSAAGVVGADIQLQHGDILSSGNIRLEARSTPGHTDGCMSLVLSSRSLAFTGDALLIRGAGRTDFQKGDARKLYQSVRNQIFTLPDHYTLYPGHDYNGSTATTVAEERAYNPRLGDGVREQDFVGYMENLGLPHPRIMKAAVPANLVCGRPGVGKTAPKIPDWGPVIRTYAGVLEIEPGWIHSHRNEVLLIDVREQDELNAGPIGRIADSILVPLSQLRDQVEDLPKDRPLITICPSGARSAQAALILEKTGFSRVANLSGGLLHWQALGFPVLDC